MRNMVKRTAAGTVLGGSLLVTGGLGIASAVPVTNISDQLVNLGVGNTNVLNDVNVDTAAQIAGLLCGAPEAGVAGTAETDVNAPGVSGTTETGTSVNVGDITPLARQVDDGSMPTTTCDSPQGVVTISQNGPANSPNAANAPGQQGQVMPQAPVPADEAPMS